MIKMYKIVSHTQDSSRNDWQVKNGSLGQENHFCRFLDTVQTRNLVKVFILNIVLALIQEW